MSQLRPISPASDEKRTRAEQAVRSARFIDSDQPLNQSGPPWSQTTVIGLDTEFVRERTFFPRPGLIQIYDGHRIDLIDPIGRDVQNELTLLMKNQSVTKVFHSVGEDLEIMAMVTGKVPEPLFDTQIAAALLGFPLQYRYETLVADCLDVELAGGQARSDWCKRPLAPHLLEYAASDVAWLIDLHDLLRDALERAGRLSWLEEDCQRLVDTAKLGDQRLPLLRVKGAGHLDAQGLGWLNELSIWREGEARRRDLPRSFILKDEVLIAIALQMSEGRVSQALKALPSREARRHGQAIEAVLDRPSPAPLERPPELERLEPAQRQALKTAQATVRSIAERLQVDPALIASKRELTKLLFGNVPDWAAGWRAEFVPQITAA